MTDAEIDALLTERGYRVQRKGNQIAVNGRPYTFAQLSNLVEMEANKPYRPFRVGEAPRSIPSPIDRLFPKRIRKPRKPVFLARQEPILPPAPPIPVEPPEPLTAAPERPPGQAPAEPAQEPVKPAETAHVGPAEPPAAVALAKGLGVCRCGRPLNHERFCRYSKGGVKPSTPRCRACGGPCGKYSRRCNTCVANRNYGKLSAAVPVKRTPIIHLTFEQRIAVLEEKVERLMSLLTL